VLSLGNTSQSVNLCASRENKSYVLKCLSPSLFELSQEHKQDFPGPQRIRLDIDYNEKERIVVYEYMKEDLLALIHKNRDFPLTARKQILLEVAKAIQELHTKNWTHLGM
jgi:serine/threonine protein kinase